MGKKHVHSKINKGYIKETFTICNILELFLIFIYFNCKRKRKFLPLMELLDLGYLVKGPSYQICHVVYSEVIVPTRYFLFHFDSFNCNHMHIFIPFYVLSKPIQWETSPWSVVDGWLNRWASVHSLVVVISYVSNISW